MKAVVLALCVVVSAALMVIPGTASAASFNLINNDSPGEGFNDPVLGPARLAAFSFALDIWGGWIDDTYGGETINIAAEMNPMPGGPTSAVLGSAGANWLHANFGSSDPDYQSSTIYGSPLANHLAGSDIHLDPEMSATFNSDVDNGFVLGGTDWYYGTDASPGGDIDFVTVVLHEVGHGLNFFGLINSTNGTWLAGGMPGIYDRFLVDAPTGGTPLTAMTNPQRKAAITSGELYWMGAGGVAGNGGNRPQIYAPSPYEGGSSVSHLDETVHTNELMSPMYSGPDHVPSDIELGMLTDMGWNLVPEPGQVAMLLGLAVMGLYWRRRQK